MMADRSVASLAVPCPAACSRAIRLIGRLAGDVSSAADCGTNDSPVMAPPAPRLTNAVACCHQALLVDGTGSPHSHDAFAPRCWADHRIAAGVTPIALSVTG